MKTSWNAKSTDEKLSCQKAESANFPEEIFHGLRSLPLKMRNGRLPKKLSSKLEKLELNSTNSKLKSKKTCSDCTKKPDPSVSPGLKVKLGSCLTKGQVGMSGL
jgi:hypothetical protein